MTLLFLLLFWTVFSSVECDLLSCCFISIPSFCIILLFGPGCTVITHCHLFLTLSTICRSGPCVIIYTSTACHITSLLCSRPANSTIWSAALRAPQKVPPGLHNLGNPCGLPTPEMRPKTNNSREPASPITPSKSHRVRPFCETKRGKNSPRERRFSSDKCWRSVCSLSNQSPRSSWCIRMLGPTNLQAPRGLEYQIPCVLM